MSALYDTAVRRFYAYRTGAVVMCIHYWNKDKKKARFLYYFLHYHKYKLGYSKIKYHNSCIYVSKRISGICLVDMTTNKQGT